MKNKFILIFFLIFSSISFAQKRSISSSNKAGTSAKQSSNNNFVFLSLLYSSSSLESENLISKRSMDDIGLSLSFKYYLSSVTLGLFYDYILNAQKEDPASLNNSNMSSWSSGYGVILGYKFNDSLNCNLFYDIDYSMKTINKNSQGNNLNFKNKTGYKVDFNYTLSKKWGIGVFYKNQELESQDFSEKLKKSGLGLNVSYSLF